MSNYDWLLDKEAEAPKVKSIDERIGKELAQGRAGSLPALDTGAVSTHIPNGTFSPSNPAAPTGQVLARN